MMSWPRLLAGLLSWLVLGGLAPTPPAPRLEYALLDLDSGYGARLTQPAEPAPAVAALPVGRVQPDRNRGVRIIPNYGVADWSLAVQAGLVADSNVNSASDHRFVSVRSNGIVVPVELGEAYLPRSGTGRGVSVAAGVKLRVADGIAFIADAEGRATDYKGRRDDDISFLFAAGPELTWSETSAVSVQLAASRDYYGGRSADAGLGVRVRYRTKVADGHRVSLGVDARRVSSDYGRAFGGTQAGAYLGYSAALDPGTTGSFGMYARREWLRAEEYSNLEMGVYGGITRHLGSALTGSLSAGFSRSWYDAPLVYLSPEPRRDWRFNAGISLTTRKPIGLGVHPLLGYSYSRTDGTIDVFDSERHRYRVGMTRKF